MKRKYELNRRYEFKATEDGVCPVPDDTEVIVWQIDTSESSPVQVANFWYWDSSITHFLATSYPKTKHKAWVNCYPDGYFAIYTTKELADINARKDRSECKEIEWDAE